MMQTQTINQRGTNTASSLANLDDCLKCAAFQIVHLIYPGPYTPLPNFKLVPVYCVELHEDYFCCHTGNAEDY